MTEGDKIFSEIAAAIRREIKKVQAQRTACKYPMYSASDNEFKFEISGLRKALAIVDPEPYRD